MGSWQCLLTADRARLTLPSLKGEDSCEEPTQVSFTAKGEPNTPYPVAYGLRVLGKSVHRILLTSGLDDAIQFTPPPMG